MPGMSVGGSLWLASASASSSYMSHMRFGTRSGTCVRAQPVMTKNGVPCWSQSGAACRRRAMVLFARPVS